MPKISVGVVALIVAAADLTCPEETALSLAISLYNAAKDDWSVSFEVSRGANTEAAVSEFATNWHLGGGQLSEFRRVVQSEIARRGILVPRVLCVALANVTLAPCDVTIVAEKGLRSVVAEGLTRLHDEVIVAILNDTLPETALAEFVRLKYARGRPDKPLVMAVPRGLDDDAAIIFDATELERWPPSQNVPTWWSPRRGGIAAQYDVSLFLDSLPRGFLLRAWWLLDDDEIENEHREQQNSDFLVIVVEQGDDDTSTAGTFADVGASLTESLRTLGFQADLRRCLVLDPGVERGCVALLSDPIRKIVLGAHNLQVVSEYTLDNNRTILYNFEHVPRRVVADTAMKNSAGTFVSPKMVDMLRQATVWDYSASNARNLRNLGVNATHVPLGWSPAWRSSIRESDDLIILFYGTLTPLRSRTLDMLRSSPAPVDVLHLNAATDGVFGKKLDAALRDAVIVLNLRAFDDDEDEWKMPRLARLLANEKFIISEGLCPDGADCSTYREGIIFVPTEELKAAIHYFLARPTERAAVARRGRALFEARPYAEHLRSPVDEFLRRHSGTR